MLHIVEFHIRLASGYEDVSHIHFGQFQHGFAGVLHLQRIRIETCLLRAQRAGETAVFRYLCLDALGGFALRKCR